MFASQQHAKFQPYVTIRYAKLYYNNLDGSKVMAKKKNYKKKINMKNTTRRKTMQIILYALKKLA